jgi:hypothetical protein
MNVHGIRTLTSVAYNHRKLQSSAPAVTVALLQACSPSDYATSSAVMLAMWSVRFNASVELLQNALVQ